MPRYYRFVISSFVILVFMSCSSMKYKPYQKAFDKEDDLIISAIEYEMHNDIAGANQAYQILYKQSGKKEYAFRNATLYAESKKYKQAYAILLDLLAIDSQDKDALQLITETYLQEKDYKNALLYSRKLIKLEKTETTYLLIANAYIVGSKFKEALQYLEKTYSYNHNVDVLDKMVSIMYLVDNDKKKAISYLESHLLLYKFNKTIANKLVLFYKEQKNINGVISIYKTLHKKFPNDGYVYELINLYIATNNKHALVRFLESSNVKSSIFKQIHGFINNSKVSFRLTKKLYKKTKDIDFLAQSLMFEYDYLYQIKKINKDKIKNMHKNFKMVLKKSPHPTYFNYMGYVLIEHNIEVKTGIKYVKQALEDNPESPYYLDSLAWGYYKMKDYQKAYETMQKVILLTGLNNISIKKHWDAIKKSVMKNKSQKQKVKK